MGDVTTTMLWVGGQVTALKLMQTLWLPCCINLALPLAVVAFQMRGQAVQAPPAAGPGDAVSGLEQRFILLVALGLLLLVPVFHGLTGLPPFMGMLLALGLLWLLADAMHRGKAPLLQQRLTLEQALHRIDLASVAFFTGILLAVAVLEHTHILAQWAQGLTQALGRQDAVVMVMGLVSAVVDNVPLLAAAMGMYPLAQNPSDTCLWHCLAYCTGTGGSMLISGSAAGVAVMGLERIPFGWYARRVGSLAVLGYLAGAGVLLWLPR